MPARPDPDFDALLAAVARIDLTATTVPCARQVTAVLSAGTDLPGRRLGASDGARLQATLLAAQWQPATEGTIADGVAGSEWVVVGPDASVLAYRDNIVSQVFPPAHIDADTSTADYYAWLDAIIAGVDAPPQARRDTGLFTPASGSGTDAGTSVILWAGDTGFGAGAPG